MIDFRLLDLNDIQTVCELMQQTGASMEGLSSKPLYYALCQDALLNDKVIIVVATKDNRMVGYVIAIIDYKSYWKTFLLHHPLIYLHIAVHKITRKIMKDFATKEIEIIKEHKFGEYISSKLSGRTWTESSHNTAKIIHIAVALSNRETGVGKELYKYLFILFRNRGIKIVDANISFDNIASIKLHISTGWQIEKKDTNLFATIEL